MPDEGVYVYAIIRAAGPLPADARGVGSPAAPLRLIRRGRVAAVVSEAPPALRARRRDLLAHQELLLRLSEQGPVLPMRFGMIAADEETVLDRLAVQEAEHLVALEHLSDGVEINVKALPAQHALASLVAEDKQVRRLRGTRYADGPVTKRASGWARRWPPHWRAGPPKRVAGSG